MNSAPPLQLSLVEYDPDTNDLKVVSLHQFEDDDIKVSQNQFTSETLIEIYFTGFQISAFTINVHCHSREVCLTILIGLVCALTPRGAVRPC